MSDYLRQVFAVVRKDLLQELRTRQRVATMGAFAVLVAVLFNYAVDPTIVRIQNIAAGLLWMTLIFAGIMGVGRTFALEAEDGAFQGVLLSPIPRDAIYLGKVIANGTPEQVRTDPKVLAAYLGDDTGESHLDDVAGTASSPEGDA